MQDMEKVWDGRKRWWLLLQIWES